jgi:hypothetical protein
MMQIFGEPLVLGEIKVHDIIISSQDNYAVSKLRDSY